jgi:hypothetical protein
MLTIANEHMIKVGQSPNLGQPQKQIEVLRNGILGVVSPDLQGGFPLDRRRALRDGASRPAHGPGIDGVVAARKIRVIQGVSILIDEEDLAAHGHALRVELEIGLLACQTIRLRDVVCVQEGQVVSKGQRDALVPGPRLA